MKEMEE
jgi:hypothetical protein